MHARYEFKFFIEKNNRAIAKEDQRRGDSESLRLGLADNQSKLIHIRRIKKKLKGKRILFQPCILSKFVRNRALFPCLYSLI